MQYLISKKDKKISRVPSEYIFLKEDEIQEILANNPQIFLGIEELEIEDKSRIFTCREFPTSRGSIDILCLTGAGEIVIVETKLLKNPESSRTVVAQVVDYVKSLTGIGVEDFLTKLKQKNGSHAVFEIHDNLKCQISDFLRKGYFKVVILGDAINPNILGMVESIQAAPHLAFTFYLVEVHALDHGEDISLFPMVVANTVEIERSVIRLEITSPAQAIVVTSEVPSKEGKGNRPKKSWNEYIESVVPAEFTQVINKFKNDWEQAFPGSINMGVVGFSAGVPNGKGRIPIQYVFDNRLLIVANWERQKYHVPDQMYEEYREELKAIPRIYDEYVVGGKVEILFAKLTEQEIEVIFNAAKNLGKKLKNADEFN